MNMIYEDNEPISQYPFNRESPRRLIAAGKTENGKLRGKLVLLRDVAERKRFRSDCAGSPSETLNEPLLNQIRQARNLLVDESGEVESR